jgi:site-specific recombinase XerD
VSEPGALAPSGGQDLERSIELDALRDQAAELIASSQAANTRRAYRADWAAFVAWCRLYGQVPLPAAPETVCLFLAAESARWQTSTLRRRLSAISQAHQAANLDSPTRSTAVRKLWQGILRTLGSEEQGAAPLVAELVRQVVQALPVSLQGTRDRGLILLGYAGAFRRSELVALEVGDVREVPRGLLVHVARSKTDQEGQGEQKPIARTGSDCCPVAAVLAWCGELRGRGIAAGRLWRSVDRHGNLGESLSDRAVSLIVKRAVQAAGLDPAEFSGHSLRAGFITSAAERGASVVEIKRVSGHRSDDIVMRYIRPATAFDVSAASHSGL